MYILEQKITVGEGTPFRSIVSFTPGGVKVASDRIGAAAQKMAASDNVLYVPDWVTSRDEFISFLDSVAGQYENYAKNIYRPDNNPKPTFTMSIPIRSAYGDNVLYQLDVKFMALGTVAISVIFRCKYTVGNDTVDCGIVFRTPLNGLSDEKLQKNVAALATITGVILNQI